MNREHGGSCNLCARTRRETHRPPASDRGTIEEWDLTLAWNRATVQLMLGALQVGHLDDLAVCNRALTDADVMQRFTLKVGLRERHE